MAISRMAFTKLTDKWRATSFIGLPLSLFFFIEACSAAPLSIVTVAGGGYPDANNVGKPTSVRVLDDGNLLIADMSHFAVLKADKTGHVTVVAGNNGWSHSGDGGRATDAQLSQPYETWPDGAGGYLIADTINHRIRRVDASGIIATVAGNGTQGYSGDGGLAIQAQLNQPMGVTPDGAGGFLVADTNNHRIRRVDASGIITTVAGNGNLGYSGNGGPALQAQIYSPHSVVSDGASGFYFSDTYCVRRVDADGIITIVAGHASIGFSGDGGSARSAQLYFPYGVSPDPAGGLYIADSYNNRIRHVDSNGIIATVAGSGDSGTKKAGFSGDGGLAVQAQLNNPMDAASDGAGGFFIADTGNLRIRHVDAQGIITTYAGDGVDNSVGDNMAAIQSRLKSPRIAALDGAGGFIFSDGDRIRRVDSHGIITTVAGDGSEGFSGDGGPAIKAQLYDPFGVMPDGAGGFLIADSDNSRIRRVDASGIITTIAGNVEPTGLGDDGPAIPAWIGMPVGLTSDGAGGFVFTSYMDNLIQRVDANGIITTVAGMGSRGFSGDDGLAVQALLFDPAVVATDGSGGFLFADTRNQRIRRVDAQGIITTVAGSDNAGIDDAGYIMEGFSGDNGSAVQAQLNEPKGVAYDGEGGFYIADTNNNRIRHVDAQGIIATIAGSGDAGYNTGGLSGDGGPADQAQLHAPYDITPDGAGGLLVVDSGNLRIRDIYEPGIPIANSQTVTTTFQTPVSIALSASKPKFVPLTYTVKNPPSHGILSGTSPFLTYAPDALFAGEDHFDFTARDGDFISEATAVTIAVAPNNITPVSSATLSPSAPDGQNGWYRTDVEVTLATTDASGPDVIHYSLDDGPEATADGSKTVTISSEGAHSLIYYAIGPTGNKEDSSHRLTINLDKTAPSIAASAKTADGATYVSGSWTTQTVTVSFACADALSGVSSVTSPKIISADGANQSATGTCSDNAGNSSSVAFNGANIDKSAPKVTFGSLSPAPNAYGWNNAKVTIPFVVSDALSGVASASPSSPLAFDAEGAAISASVTVADAAGNSAQVSSPPVKIDKTPPTLTATAKTADGESYVSGSWTNQTVTVSFSCADALSGVASVTSPAILSAEGANQSAIGTCSDKAGNSSSVAINGVNIDKTPPTVRFGDPSPAPNANGWNDADVTIPYHPEDDASGVASVVISDQPDNSLNLVLSAEGAAVSETIIVTDAAGNAARIASPPVKIDKTPPTIAATATTADGEPYAGGTETDQNVTVSFDGSDALSGLDLSSARVAVTFEGASESAEGTLADIAGNVASVVFSGILVKNSQTVPQNAVAFVVNDLKVVAIAPRSGDLDGNGKVTIQDVTLAMRMMIGLISPTADQITIADLNGNGRIDVADVNNMLRVAIGLMTLSQ